MITTNGLNHLALPVKDPERSGQFYADLFNMEIISLSNKHTYREVADKKKNPFSGLASMVEEGEKFLTSQNKNPTNVGTRYSFHTDRCKPTGRRLRTGTNYLVI